MCIVDCVSVKVVVEKCPDLPFLHKPALDLSGIERQLVGGVWLSVESVWTVKSEVDGGTCNSINLGETSARVCNNNGNTVAPQQG